MINVEADHVRPRSALSENADATLGAAIAPRRSTVVGESQQVGGVLRRSVGVAIGRQVFASSSEAWISVLWPARPAARVARSRQPAAAAECDVGFIRGRLA